MKKTNPNKRLRYWLNLCIAGLLFGLFLYYILLSFQLIRPAPSAVTGPTPAEWGATFDDVSILMKDGISLKGWFIPSQNGEVVILLHGYGSNRLQMLWHAQILSEAGYGVLLYDQRASGESGGKWRTWGWQDVVDMEMILSYLNSEYQISTSKISLWGASTGAEIAVLTLEQYPELKRIIADGPGYSTAADLPPNRSLADRFITAPVGPVLSLMGLITGVHPQSSLTHVLQNAESEKIFLISTGTGFEKLMGDNYSLQSGEKSQYWNVPDAAHTLIYLIAADEYARRVLEFLAD